MILFLELFTFIILLNFEVLRKITFMIFVFYFFIGFRNHYFYLSSKLCKFLESLNGRFFCSFWWQIYNEFSLVASFLALKNTEKCDFFYIYN